MAGDLTHPARHALAGAAPRASDLRLWGVTMVATGVEYLAILDRLPGQSQGTSGWTAQAGMRSEDTRALEIDGLVDFGELGQYRISDIEADGHGWSVLDLRAL